ncbi:MAG: GGDEF domain-containing protein [Actinomycetota bacterium]
MAVLDPAPLAPDEAGIPRADADHKAPSFDREVQDFFLRSRWFVVAATALTSPVIVAATWPLADHGPMLTYLAIHQVSVIAMAMTFALPVTPASGDRLPPVAMLGLITAQLTLSTAPFFDAGAARTADFAFGIGIVLFAFAAGVVATLGPLRSMARVTVLSMFPPYVAATFVYGHPGLAIGTIFAVIVIAGVAIEKTGRLFEELRALRRLASERADEAEAIATTDALTGLTNRYGLELLDDELLQREVFGIFIDLDKFKAVNDTLGHRAGDHVLVEVASRLTRYVRPSDTVARLGGDEFFILLWSDHEIPVMDIADRIRAAVDRPILFEGELADVSASIGVSRQSPGILNLEALIQSADEALYMAKSLGRNQVFASSVRLNASAGVSPPPSERSNGTLGRRSV